MSNYSLRDTTKKAAILTLYHDQKRSESKIPEIAGFILIIYNNVNI